MDFARMNLHHIQPEFTGSNYGAAGGFGFAGGPTQINGGPSANEYNSTGTFLLRLPTKYGRILQVPDEYTTRTSHDNASVPDPLPVSPTLNPSYGMRFAFYP